MKGYRESDQLIVLRVRESRAQGEGADGYTQPVKETLTEQGGSELSMQTSLQGIAKKVLCLGFLRKRV